MTRSKEHSPGLHRKRAARKPGPIGVDPTVGRDEFVQLSREYFAVLRRNLIEHRSRATEGKAFVRDYTRIVDTMVGLLLQRAAKEHEAATGELDIAIIGMGGYGRAELAPFSDVDILVLCKRKTALVRRITSSFIQLMWDVGFELGHAVESIIESEKTLGRHMDTRTALFESRWVCGSQKLGRDIQRQIRRLRQKDRSAFLVRKISDAVSLRKKQTSSYQLIEPNVKVSPGGMRDFQTLVWLGMVVGGKTGMSELRKKGLLLSGEATRLEQAYDFLLRVRVELHLATESKQDQLTVAIQKIIAERLGYRARKGHLAVERFMRDYYGHTRTIHTIIEDIIEELDYGKNVAPLLGRRKTPKRDGKLSARVSRDRLRKEPLYIFSRQKQEGLRLDRGLKRRLADLLKEDLRTKASLTKMRVAFPELLANGKNVTLVLRSMHETGFLGAIIPEYNELTSLKRYDLYHHYTVDEHSFQVVHNIERLHSTRSRELAPLARLYSELPNKQTLYLTALLHDIGKIEGKGHAKKGAALSKRILKRLSLEDEDIRAVSYLIEIHLLMSHFSQRRDPTDMGTLRTFTEKVKSRKNLKHLCLLTYADLKATSPTVWNEWKRTLLWALYVSAYRYMFQTEKEPETVYKARKQTIMRAFAKRVDKRNALEHLDMLPGRYLLTMSPAQVKQHMKMVDGLEKDGASVVGRKRRRATEITFCTYDKPYRLSQLCGVLTLNDCNILFAYAFTRTDGKVLDVFYVQDITGAETIDEARVDKIRRDLAGILKAGEKIRADVDRNLLKWKRKTVSAIPIPVQVEFDNDLSGEATIIDIFAMDRPGLLFKIAHALSDEGLTIHRARISTEANRAIDSFDVQDSKGNKITAVTKLSRIRSNLEAALS